MKIKIGRRRYDLGFVLSKYARGVVSAKLVKRLYLGENRKTNNTIVVTSHTFSGNAKAFAMWLVKNQKKYKVLFATDDPKFYKRAKKSGLGVDGVELLSLQNPLHIKKIAQSKAVVMTHGLLTLLDWKKISKDQLPILVETWHGVGFKGGIVNALEASKVYSAIFVSSKYFRDLHVSWGFPKDKLKVTGYARTDRLLEPVKDRAQVLSSYDLPEDAKKIVLFAPTWKLNPDNELEILGEPLPKILNKIERLASKHNFLAVFRTHINSDIENNDRSSDSLAIVPSSEYPDTEDLLRVSDVVVTDWSSIYTDFMVTGRPTVFIDSKPDFDGRALQPSDRAGAKANSYKKLSKAIVEAVEKTEEYSKKYSGETKEAIKKAWGSNADGKSRERYYKELTKLIK